MISCPPMAHTLSLGSPWVAKGRMHTLSINNRAKVKEIRFFIKCSSLFSFCKIDFHLYNNKQQVICQQYFVLNSLSCQRTYTYDLGRREGAPSSHGLQVSGNIRNLQYDTLVWLSYTLRKSFGTFLRVRQARVTAHSSRNTPPCARMVSGSTRPMWRVSFTCR